MMKQSICKLSELDLRELAEFTSLARGQGINQAGRFAVWFEEDLVPLEHVVILEKDAGELVGWVLLVLQEYEKVEINPWLLGGHPIVSPNVADEKNVSAALLDESVKWAQGRGAKSILLTIPLGEDEDANQANKDGYEAQGFPELLKYVEMKCDLSAHGVMESSLYEGVMLAPLNDVDEDELYSCYLNAFQHGDAKFFFTQSQAERRDYFDTLGLEDAREHPGSSVLRKDGAVIGFTYVLPYGAGNCHISCMCVHPEFQGKGLGQAMLHHAMHEAHESGLLNMTLGTETEMRAFRLYEKNGFVVLGGAMIFERELF